jgi:two-component system, LuxR family, sensor kinase FixL
MSESDTSEQRASSAVLRYGLAVSSVAAALIVTLVLRPDALVAPIFFLAIILTAWFGGFGPGLVAALLSTLALLYFFLQPVNSLRFNVSELPHLLVFFVTAFLVSSWSAGRRRAETLLLRARDELEAKVQERTANLRQSNEQLQTEIAERLRAEEVLQKQTVELRDQAQLLELAHDAILVRDLASQIFFWNRGAEKMYGWTREEAKGEVTHKFLQTEFPRSFEETEAELRGEGYWEGELVHTTRDGSRLVVASRQVLQRDQSGNPVAILEINNDITERKRAGEAMREQASLLNLTHDTVFVRGMNDAITYWNRGAEELYGWKKEEAIGQITHQLMQTIFPAPLEAINEELLDRGRWEGELTHTRRDGGRVIVASRWSLQRDEHGQPVAILETNNDITERKRAEEALQKTQAELAHVTRVTALGELTASIAHEVNQPLAAVVTNGNACLRWLARQPPDLLEAQQAVGRIIKDGNRASEVIGRIRRLVKKAPSRKDWVDLNDIIHEVIALAQSEIQRHRISLITQLSDGLPLVLGDRIQLQQVILNLIINGIEAMSRLKEEPRELLINAGKDDSNGLLLVAVRDTGMGLDSANLDQLFDAFYTTKPDGMGMGLAISRSIIEAHGGRLWATVNSPHGAVFQFTLPAGGNKVP